MHWNYILIIFYYNILLCDFLFAVENVYFYIYYRIGYRNRNILYKTNISQTQLYYNMYVLVAGMYTIWKYEQMYKVGTFFAQQITVKYKLQTKVFELVSQKKKKNMKRKRKEI